MCKKQTHLVEFNVTSIFIKEYWCCFQTKIEYNLFVLWTTEATCTCRLSTTLLTPDFKSNSLRVDCLLRKFVL